MNSKIWQKISSPIVSALINLGWDLRTGIFNMWPDDADAIVF